MTKKSLYLELKERHQQETNNFPFMFAFSNEQFDEGMKKLGLNPTDTDKIISIGMGGFVKKTNKEAMNEMFGRHEQERQQAIESDITGEGYIYDMFKYELSNHEYGYTYELDQALEALGLTLKEINSKKNLLNGLNKALERY